MRFFGIIILCCIPLGSAFAQVGGGLPALNVLVGNDGETTYSLSLQILALNDSVDDPAILFAWYNCIYADHHNSVDSAPSNGHPADPPNQVLISIALFLTFYVMAPTFEEIYTTTISPYLAGELSAVAAIEGSANIMRGFLILNTREAELAMFAEMAGDAPYASNEDVPYAVLLPAFITSELKTAFQIGFLLFFPSL
jgi:Flagellar biosynthesis pathway, component FliP